MNLTENELKEIYLILKAIEDGLLVNPIEELEFFEKLMKKSIQKIEKAFAEKSMIY